MRILVTGGAGFIGSNLIQRLLLNKENKVFNLDKMGYASSTKSIDNFDIVSGIKSFLSFPTP